MTRVAGLRVGVGPAPDGVPFRGPLLGEAAVDPVRSLVPGQPVGLAVNRYGLTALDAGGPGLVRHRELRARIPESDPCLVLPLDRPEFGDGEEPGTDAVPVDQAVAVRAEHEQVADVVDLDGPVCRMPARAVVAVRINVRGVRDVFGLPTYLVEFAQLAMADSALISPKE